MSKNKEKPKICPACNNTVTISDKQATNYILLYRPFKCEHCGEYYEVSHIAKLIFIATSLLILIAGFNIDIIFKLEEDYPSIKTFIVAAVAAVTIIMAIVFSKMDDFTLVPQHRVLATLFHYTYLILPVLSLCLFACLQNLHSP